MYVLVLERKRYFLESDEMFNSNCSIECIGSFKECTRILKESFNDLIGEGYLYYNSGDEDIFKKRTSNHLLEKRYTIRNNKNKLQIINEY